MGQCHVTSEVDMEFIIEGLKINARRIRKIKPVLDPGIEEKAVDCGVSFHYTICC